MIEDNELLERFIEFLEDSTEYSGSDSVFNIKNNHTIEVLKPSDEMQMFYIWMHRDTLPQA